MTRVAVIVEAIVNAYALQLLHMALHAHNLVFQSAGGHKSTVQCNVTMEKFINPVAIPVNHLADI